MNRRELLIRCRRVLPLVRGGTALCRARNAEAVLIVFMRGAYDAANVDRAGREANSTTVHAPTSRCRAPARQTTQRCHSMRTGRFIRR